MQGRSPRADRFITEDAARVEEHLPYRSPARELDEEDKTTEVDLSFTTQSGSGLKRIPVLD
jgi:hypothetical protein